MFIEDNEGWIVIVYFNLDISANLWNLRGFFLSVGFTKLIHLPHTFRAGQMRHLNK